MAAGAAADTVSTSGRASLFASQLAVLDGRASQQYNTSDRLQPPRVEIPAAAASPAYAGRYAGPYLALARTAARTHGVPEDLFLRLVQMESGWNAGAVSHKGAIGLAQLMPETARAAGGRPDRPAGRTCWAARAICGSSTTPSATGALALAAYNAGPGAVQQYGGIPPYAETQQYVVAIWGS